MKTTKALPTRNFPHGIMFHHFHGTHHPNVLGSIDAGQFSEMLNWLEKRHNVLSAAEFQTKATAGMLSPNDICITLDDALKCQHDIAHPILVERGLTAFFFMQSAPLVGEPHYLEVFRLFREVAFADLEEFHDEFFDRVQAIVSGFSSHKQAFREQAYLSEYAFYSENERWFRYIRDRVIGSDTYQQLMLAMMDEKGFMLTGPDARLYMTPIEVTELASFGHIIGLHSHSHPTAISKLSTSDQRWQYAENLRHLERILGAGSVNSMSHPCGSYSKDTLKILQEMDIRLGFCSAIGSGHAPSLMELPREDHINVLAEMQS